MEHRSGLIVKTTVTPGRRPRRTRRGARDDRGVPRPAPDYRRPPTRATTRATSSPICAACDVTPHVAQHTTGRRSAIDARTTRHPGYAISQQKRKLVEQGFGWMKTIGGLAQAAAPRRPAGRTGSSPSRRRRTTSCGCGACWTRPREARGRRVRRLRHRVRPRSRSHRRSDSHDGSHYFSSLLVRLC